jgi:amidase
MASPPSSCSNPGGPAGVHPPERSPGTALPALSLATVRAVSEPLHRFSARALRDAVTARELSATEVVFAHLERIEQVNPRINAIVTLVPERALADAAALDAAAADGRPAGLLQGLPVAVKDLIDTAGIRTTYGSPIYARHVPAEDDLIVQRLRAAGAIVIGKTNTPEFGAGSHTFNDVFGATRNPYDLTRSAGGSSGGAAAALGAGMIPIADGSDLGGSLRNPASFCNVVGLRPAPGRVAAPGPGDGWSPMSQLGPMARTVGDVALLLAAIAGPDSRDPLALDAPFPASVDIPASLAGMRIAWSETVDGLPVEPAVTAALRPARAALADLGAELTDTEPDLRGADEVFETYRSLAFGHGHAEEARVHRELIKEEVMADVRRGEALSVQDVMRAADLRTELFRRTSALLERYDLLALPTVQVVPFDVELRWPATVAGETMERYYTWMRSCSRITSTTLPAVSLPAGFTPEGLPVGLQLVGRHRGEARLLSLAAVLEARLDAGSREPAL